MEEVTIILRVSVVSEQDLSVVKSELLKKNNKIEFTAKLFIFQYSFSFKYINGLKVLDYSDNRVKHYFHSSSTFKPDFNQEEFNSSFLQERTRMHVTVNRIRLTANLSVSLNIRLLDRPSWISLPF